MTTPQSATRNHRRTGFFRKPAILCFVLLGLAGMVHAANPGLRYSGRVLYRASKTPVAGVLVELVEAEDNGEPTDDVLGNARADADGRFAIVLTEPTDKPVALVVSAVRQSADSSGDRRQEGFDIKTHQTRLGFLPHPSPTKSNLVLIERRRLGHSEE